MKRFATSGFVLCVLLSTLEAAHAGPTAIGLGGFSGNETLIDFNARSHEEPINIQYVGQGVTFGGALYGLSASGDPALFPNGGGGVIASNWLYSESSHQGTSFTATFPTLQRRVGFYAETNLADDIAITVELGGNPQGSISFDTSTNVVFVGVEDPSGFNSITVSVSGPDNNFLAIDDFRFEAIPEPSSLLLVMAAGMVLSGRRFRLSGSA